MAKPQAKPRRRWFQFGMKTLLAGMLTLALAVWGYCEHRARISAQRRSALHEAVNGILVQGLRREKWRAEHWPSSTP
jgi:hypothetical protein